MKPARVMLVAGLFGFAFLWIALMYLIAVLGGTKATAAPPDDGSLKANFTHIERGKDFEISLSLKLTDRDGKIVEGLDSQEFEVYEDGVLVDTKEFTTAGKGPVRLALVVDYSRSMNGRKITEARTAARTLIRMMQDHRDVLGLYFFNNHLQDAKRQEVLPMMPLDLLRREQAWEAIMFTGLGDGSPMLNTMQKALEALDKVSGRRILVVLTDGMDTGERDEVDAEKKTLLAKCEEMKVPLYMVNMSTDVADETMMRELADKTNGVYVPVPAPEQLKDIFINIGKSLQSEYTITYESPNPAEDGTTRKVTVNARKDRVGTQAKGDYKVPGVVGAGGGGSKRSGGSSAGRGLSLMALTVVFVGLTGLLGLLLAVPTFLHFLTPPNAAGEAAAAAPLPTAASHSRAAPGAIQAKRKP